MNILYFMTYGYSIKTWDEAGHLSRELKYFNQFTLKKDVNYIFVSFGDSAEYAYISQFKNCKVIPVYEYLNKSEYKLINLIKSFYIPFVLKKLLSEERVDIIKQNQLLGSWISIGLKFLIRKPLIVRTGYDMYTFSKKANNGFLKNIFYYILTQITLIQSDQYTVTSNIDLKEINKYLFKGKNIALFPNWVSEQPICNINQRNDLNLLTVGRLEKQKNIEKIIKDFKNTEYEIDIIGDGSDKEFLKELAKKYNTKVKFLGSIENDEVLNSYKNYKYYISSSTYEGNPKTILEAMSSGCIIVALKNPNVEEIIKHTQNGFLVDDKELSFVEAIKDISKYKDIENISKNAILYVKENNSLENLIESEYKSMIKLK